jgi:hypothetical protein
MRLPIDAHLELVGAIARRAGRPVRRIPCDLAADGTVSQPR